ncbi:deoxyribonuclease V [Luteimonas vadosa]|uniref:Endonuclease V n=2 Tax=Luteimonas vadosa TaxID=1165507 RepID=A0ABP9DW79_9GAMM
MPTAFEGWDGTPAAARAMQAELASQVRLRDGFRKPLRTVAGFDVGFEDAGRTTRAAAVLLDADSLQVLESRCVRIPTSLPYIPGLLSFRELPALLQVLDALSQTPDLALLDGQGIAHPRGLGVAAHFGLATGVPSIGVAKKILTGSGPEPHDTRGAYTALRHDGRQVGWLLRSKLHCRPLVVSPGHHVAMASAADLVMRWVTTYRLPEPTRLADRLASRRDDR